LFFYLPYQRYAWERTPGTPLQRWETHYFGCRSQREQPPDRPGRAQRYQLHQPERGLLYTYRRSLRLGQRLWNRSHEIDFTLWFYGIEPQSHPDRDYGR